MAKNFDELLQNIHDSVSDDTTKLDNNGKAIDIIEVTSARKFLFNNSFNKIIAYAGDINSQVLTFKIPLTHDNHYLNKCTYKKVKWKNQGNGIEGVNDLILGTVNAKDFLVTWEISPEAFVSAGVLEFSFSFYDQYNGNTVFSWNTSKCSELSVGTGFEEFGGIETPATNEILLIDVDERRIIMPAGYNTTVANFGDIGTAKIHFRIKKDARGIDISGTNTEICVHYAYLTGNYEQKLTDPKIKKAFVNGESSNDLVDFTWQLPDDLTYNTEHYIGTFKISLTFKNNGSKWTTAPFGLLSIGESMVLGDGVQPDTPTNPFLDKTQYFIDGNDWSESSGNNEIQSIPGIVQTRMFSSTNDNYSTSKIYKRELVVVEDENGNFGLKVGTTEDQKVKDGAFIVSTIPIEDQIKEFFGKVKFTIIDEE